MNTKIAVIEGQRKVVARIDGCQCAVKDYIFKRTGLIVNDDSILLRPTYKASAKCHPDDDFDQATGARLASDRAREKYENAFNNALDNAKEICWKIIDLPWNGGCR